MAASEADTTGSDSEPSIKLLLALGVALHFAKSPTPPQQNQRLTTKPAVSTFKSGVAVGVRIARADGDVILLFPITSREPEAPRFSAEIPLIEKRHVLFDGGPRLSIIFDEFNTDIVGRSFNLEPEPRLIRRTPRRLAPFRS
ncbi:MAG: hypothetical protein HC888_07230 [Candidatus Competibacteraceae bacterium]|nr:hypothetical protein [Candidatus Competibacteraceae bacterium]NJO53570.1 hypothetical protein [Bacteroidales bacterium]